MYRQPASPAKEKETFPQRTFYMWEGTVHELFPHEHGRWACPACGAWRWIAMLTREAEHAVGVIDLLVAEKRYVRDEVRIERTLPGPDAPEGQVLKRSCPRCEFIWRVKLKGEL